MSPITPYEANFIKRLTAAGVIPPECRSLVLRVAAADIIRMELDVFVTADQMDQIVSALEENPEEAKRIAREIVFHDRATGRTADVKL
jgi:hypothetical protein